MQQGWDAALVATDAVPAFEWSKGIFVKHGTLVFIGQPKDTVPFHLMNFIAQDLTIRAGCLGQASVVQEMVYLAQVNGIEVHSTIYRMDAIEKLVHDYHQPGMKGNLAISME